MSEFSSLTHKFRANIDGQQAGGNKISKRNRQPLSCAPCRLKKLKCDRGHPCETCVKRGDQTSCTYGKLPAVKASETTANGGISSNHRGRAQERLRHLEQLVMQMVDPSSGAQSNRGSESATSNESPTDGVAMAGDTIAKQGHLQYGSSESRYVGSTHWSAILENLQELKSAIANSPDSGDQPSSSELDESDEVEPPDTDDIFGSTSHLSIPQILAQNLPSRLQVDRRLSTYFNSRYLVIPFIHTAQFQRQYEQFWRTPLETPPLWISILFSVCCLSAGLSEAVGSEPSTPEDQPSPRVGFLNAACQCLRLGGFTRPKRHVVEALGLYAQCKYMSTLDPSKDVGVIFSIVVRLAYRSGYHRDANQFPHISIFEGEMRRRVWAMCRQFDLMVSFQLGLPNQIPPNSWDTQNPRNLLDTDFDETTKVLPPSRPETEATQMLYFIVKSRLMTTFGRVCAHALSFGNENCSNQVMELDREARATYATVPQILHIKPMSQSFADPSYLTMVRTNCEFLYQKSLLVLHRKYMTLGTHPESTRACTDAAMAITRHMLDLHKEFKPGGQLFQDRWMLSSFTTNDFYLAGMVLCLGVSMWRKSNPGKDVNEDPKMKEQYQMLKDSLDICEELSPTSNEAKRVASVLRTLLDEKIDGTPASDRSAAANTGDSNPFSRPGRFMPSAMFPMQYDFNLTPLTLEEKDRVRETTSSTSDSSSYLMHGRQTPFNGGDVSTANAGYSTGGNFQNLMPGINNPSGLGDSFMSYFPFSPSYLAQNAGSNQTQSPDFSGANDSQNIGMGMNMGVDWPMLDQWMAFPNPADIIPFNDEDMPNPTRPSGSYQDERLEDMYPALSDSQGSGLATDADTEWTSTPYAFLGREAGTTSARQHNGTGDTLMLDGRTQPAKQGRGHAEGQYPSY
ncbi:hypothetical protein H2200_002249 [Cladophialophora chaetospira]|uniref:Zn(2)-C6 fungal-type domain-containing protein n=1 Tax=Cladophialophora chaetospira TaxID=386627 RepID=A0AA38XIQ7_9EURO|nr:hypothetical protein H2200_002249 [Cladophialophora chaetospira]